MCLFFCDFAQALDVWTNEVKRTSGERLNLERLRATHESVLAWKKERKELPAWPGRTDYRGIFHAHASDSAHTGGTIEEMHADAQKAKVQVIFLSDHFRPPKDFMDSWRGVKDGVLYVPGSESKGFLVHPQASIFSKMDLPSPQFIPEVTRDGGLIFLSHVEERPGHSMEGLSGQEIYNRHADAKSDMASLLKIVSMMTNPERLQELETAVAQFPDELLAFQVSYSKTYLEKWDQETPARRLVGVAANDCHHNQVFIMKMVDENTVLVGTNVDPDDKKQKLTATLMPGIKRLTAGKKPGDILAKLDVDPYHVSFHNASTHILGRELNEKSIREDVAAGHIYVSHDWMCDPTGFVFWAEEKGKVSAIMGDETKWSAGVELRARFPVPAQFRLIQNGKVAHEGKGREWTHPITAAGVYRLEVWLVMDGELRPWIYTNPIYVR